MTPTQTPAPAPTGSSGFDQYQQQQASTATTTTSALSSGVTATGSNFPSTYASSAISYPGISKEQLLLPVPGTGQAAVDKGVTGPGTTLGTDLLPAVERGLNAQFGVNQPGTPDLSIQQLMDSLLKNAQAHPEEIAKLQDQLILGGYLDPRSSQYSPAGVVMPGDATWDAYSNLLLDSIRLNTPWQDLLDQHVQSQDGTKKFNLDTTTSYVNVTNPQAAKLSLAQVMERDLGRQPTNAEIGQFAAYLSGQEQANPVVTTSHQDLSSYLNNKQGKSAHRSVTTSGGANPTASAETFDLANNGQEMATTQADQVYDIFRTMLAGSG